MLGSFQHRTQRIGVLMRAACAVSLASKLVIQDSSCYGDQTRLVQVQVVFRHGARTPENKHIYNITPDWSKHAVNMNNGRLNPVKTLKLDGTPVRWL